MKRLLVGVGLVFVLVQLNALTADGGELRSLGFFRSELEEDTAFASEICTPHSLTDFVWGDVWDHFYPDLSTVLHDDHPLSPGSSLSVELCPSAALSDHPVHHELTVELFAEVNAIPNSNSPLNCTVRRTITSAIASEQKPEGSCCHLSLPLNRAEDPKILGQHAQKPNKWYLGIKTEMPVQAVLSMFTSTIDFYCLRIRLVEPAMSSRWPYVFLALVSLVVIALTALKYRATKNSIAAAACLRSSGGAGNQLLSPSELQLNRKLATGSMTQVYEGLLRGSRRVAVKKIVLSRNSRQRSQQEVEFEREVGLLGSLIHPNILCLLGYLREEQSLFLVTELAEKGNLRNLLISTKPSWKVTMQLELERPSIFRMALDITAGLCYLHGQGIMHRDLKSPNVLVFPHALKLCDFGLAKLTEQTVAEATCSMGTVQWCAPEVMCGDVYTELADIYSLGVVLWELATRQEPYENWMPAQVIGHVMELVQSSPRSTECPLALPINTPHWFSSLVESCLAVNPRLRPPVANVNRALIQVLQSSSGSPASS